MWIKVRMAPGFARVKPGRFKLLRLWLVSYIRSRLDAGLYLGKFRPYLLRVLIDDLLFYFKSIFFHGFSL